MTTTPSSVVDGAHWVQTGPATAAVATALRRRIRRWAEALGLPEDLTHAIELAGYEALANVVEHAYHRVPRTGRNNTTETAHPSGSTARDHASTDAPGTMTLTATSDRDAITVTVADTGVWQLPPPAPDRKHGLALIEAISDHLTITGTDHGTQVVIVWTHSGPATI